MAAAPHTGSLGNRTVDVLPTDRQTGKSDCMVVSGQKRIGELVARERTWRLLDGQ
jgi:hypothetical protein